jgi:hypothetical protein
MPASFVYGQVSLSFRVEGEEMRATFKYKYRAADGAVEYTSIEYSDPRLKEKVEGDPAVRRRVDAYIAKLLSKRNEGLS